MNEKNAARGRPSRRAHCRVSLKVLLVVIATAGVARTAIAQTADDLELRAAARVADAVCDKRVVLLGELPEHGHARGFGVKARIIERLVKRRGFDAVLFEAGSYDFFGLERAIATRSGAIQNDSLELALARAIGGFWWTRELAPWRRWLLREMVAGRVAVGGLDDQPSATAAYAREGLPGLVGDAVPEARAAECREAIARYVRWGYTTATPYDGAERRRLADCARMAAGRARAAATAPARTLAARTVYQLMLDDVASHFARERVSAEGGAGTPDRDLVMAQHLEWWSARLPRDARIVVWTATTHAARADGSAPVLPDGVLPLGARLAERWGSRLAVIGFTALGGQWSQAGKPSQALAPLPPHALEARALVAGAAGDTAEWAYLDRKALRALGAVPSRLFGAPRTHAWSTAFDGVLVIRREVAPTVERRR